MQITDGELGLALAMGGRLRSDARAAQAVVDRKNAQLSHAHRQLNSVQAQNRELIAERTARHREKIMAYLVHGPH